MEKPSQVITKLELECGCGTSASLCVYWTKVLSNKLHGHDASRLSEDPYGTFKFNSNSSKVHRRNHTTTTDETNFVRNKKLSSCPLSYVGQLTEH